MKLQLIERIMLWCFNFYLWRQLSKTKIAVWIGFKILSVSMGMWEQYLNKLYWVHSHKAGLSRPSSAINIIKPTQSYGDGEKELGRVSQLQYMTSPQGGAVFHNEPMHYLDCSPGRSFKSKLNLNDLSKDHWVLFFFLPCIKRHNKRHNSSAVGSLIIHPESK